MKLKVCMGKIGTPQRSFWGKTMGVKQKKLVGSEKMCVKKVSVGKMGRPGIYHIGNLCKIEG